MFQQSTIKQFLKKKETIPFPLCLHINHHHRHKYPLNEILYNNITEIRADRNSGFIDHAIFTYQQSMKSNASELSGQ